MGVMIDDILRNGPPLVRPPPARVAQAQAALEAGTATAADMRVLVQQAASDTQIFLQGTRPKPLNAESLSGACGTGRDVSAASLGELGANSPRPIFLDRFQAEQVLGVNRHGFSVVTFPDGQQFLVDPTFGQFRTGAGAVLGESAGGSRLARDLLRDGFVELTDENARLYARALGVAESDAAAMGRRLTQGESPLLTEVVGEGRPSNVPQLSGNVPDYTVVEAIATLEDHIAGLRAAGDPRGLIPSMEAMLERLRRVPARPAAPYQHFPE
jgi:hypothetical protein